MGKSKDTKNSEDTSKDASFDQNTHLRILSDNLKRFSGKSLLQHMKNAEAANDSNTGSNGSVSMRAIGAMMETSAMKQDAAAADASNANIDDDDDSWSTDHVHLSMRFALLSHGAVNGMDGPVHNYANFAALSAFSYTRQQILRIPACRMAAPGSEQADLSQLYMTLRQEQRLGNNNILQNHQALHCTQYLQRFLIRNAMVSLVDYIPPSSARVPIAHFSRFLLRFGTALTMRENITVRPFSLTGKRSPFWMTLYSSVQIAGSHRRRFNVFAP
jgi:MEKHLA domain